MKTGKVAKAFGIDRKTVTNWTDIPEFQKFFTPGALGIDRTQRDYKEQDLLVINTIRSLRDQNVAWHDIADYLETGDRELELPATAMLVETTAPIAQYGRIIELQSALDSSVELVSSLQEEVQRLRSEFQQRVDQVRDQERQKATDRERQLLDEIIQLNRQMARLEMRMEMMQEEDDDDDED